MFHHRQYAMAMGVFLQCVAHCTGLATRRPRHLHVSLVFYVATNARGDPSRGFNTDVGGAVDAGAEASGGAAGTGDSAATGTDFGIGT